MAGGRFPWERLSNRSLTCRWSFDSILTPSHIQSHNCKKSFFFSFFDITSHLLPSPQKKKKNTYYTDVVVTLHGYELFKPLLPKKNNSNHLTLPYLLNTVSLSLFLGHYLIWRASRWETTRLRIRIFRGNFGKWGQFRRSSLQRRNYHCSVCISYI